MRAVGIAAVRPALQPAAAAGWAVFWGWACRPSSSSSLHQHISSYSLLLQSMLCCAMLGMWIPIAVAAAAAAVVALGSRCLLPRSWHCNKSWHLQHVATACHVTQHVAQHVIAPVASSMQAQAGSIQAEWNKEHVMSSALQVHAVGPAAMYAGRKF